MSRLSAGIVLSTCSWSSIFGSIRASFLAYCITDESTQQLGTKKNARLNDVTFLSERRLLCRQQTKVFFITLQFRTLAWSQRYVSAQHVRSTLNQTVDKFSVALSYLLLLVLICQLICTFQNEKILFCQLTRCNDVVCRARRPLLGTCQTPILDTMTTNTKIITSTKTCTNTLGEFDVDAELEQLLIRGRRVFVITLNA